MLGKSYASITKPLQKMMSDLNEYVKAQGIKIKTLTTRKLEIDKQINHSQLEITKSNATVSQIKNMVITDKDAMTIQAKDSED